MKVKFSFVLICLILMPWQPVLAGEITLYFTDASGSPVAATDVDGNIIWREHYQPYGEKLNEPLGEDIGYTGHEFDAETGLTYMQARYYDPEVGRFLAIDPVGFKPDQPMTFNRYSYANNNPYKYKDPTGMDCTSNDGTTTCNPNDERFESFSFSTPKGWTDFKEGDASFHDYTQEESAGMGDEAFGERLTEELIKSPTPGEGAATSGGNIIDVDIPGPFGIDEVISTVRKTSDGNSYITNVTTDNHTLNSGFVIRQNMSDGNGGYKIVTYGEGNAIKQTLPGANSAATSTWHDNARAIIEQARNQ